MKDEKLTRKTLEPRKGGSTVKKPDNQTGKKPQDNVKEDASNVTVS